MFVVEQNQTQTSENNRQRDTDLRSVELGNSDAMDMMQIGLILREIMENERKMESRLKESIKEMFKEPKKNGVNVDRNTE